jgi:hypothetical protein
MVHDAGELFIPVSCLSTGWWACPLLQHFHPSNAHVVQRSGTNLPQSRAFMPHSERNEISSPRCTKYEVPSSHSPSSGIWGLITTR